jgi:hypothetical protein
MTDAPVAGGSISTPPAVGTRHQPLVTLLFVLAVLALGAGVSVVLAAKLSIVHQLTTPAMPTLSVFGPQPYYFPPHSVAAYPSLAVGVLLAGAGVILLVACSIITLTRPRAE